MTLNEISKFLSLILRHKPETIGISLDEHGWANVEELVSGVGQTYPFTKEMLEEIVRADNKTRYSFNEDKTMIRANQGRSIPVDVELAEAQPPEVLYHGTGAKYEVSIDEQGLISKSRLYARLSADEDTARKVGMRHGKPVVYQVASGAMAAKGYAFYLSVNGVWLTKSAPVEFLQKLYD